MQMMKTKFPFLEEIELLQSVVPAYVLTMVQLKLSAKFSLYL